jgi:hypothetical protein
MPHLNKRGRIYRPYLILYSQPREWYFDYAFYISRERVAQCGVLLEVSTGHASKLPLPFVPIRHSVIPIPSPSPCKVRR